ncbi:MAG: 3-isopropylmalate dehydratase small subunit [Hyphomicrobiaceae bacterium]
MTASTNTARKPFTSLTAVAMPINQANVDTDQIIPARYLSQPPDAMPPFLFQDARYREDGTPRPEFVMNRSEFKAAEIIVGGRNFACGSSREAAVWVIKGNGFKAVIAPSFGDIFYNNCFQNGILPIRLPEARVNELLRFLMELPGASVTVDLAQQVVTGPDGKADKFEIDPFRKECLLKGIDDIELTLTYADQIAAFEKRSKTAVVEA